MGSRSDEDDLPTEADFEAPLPSEERSSWVFVSHSAADYVHVRDMLRGFEAPPKFLTFHIANRAQAIHIQNAYKRGILKNLSRCAWFIVVVSNASIRSVWVQFEVAWAVRHKPINRVICLMLDGSVESDLHPRLSLARKIDVRPLVRRGPVLTSWLARKRLRWALPQSSLERWMGGGGFGILAKLGIGT